MATVGIMRNSKKQQRTNAELELIIEEFGKAMRNAYRPFIADGPTEYCCHSRWPFTPSMQKAWIKYTEFCVKNPQ